MMDEAHFLSKPVDVTGNRHVSLEARREIFYTSGGIVGDNFNAVVKT